MSPARRPSDAAVSIRAAAMRAVPAGQQAETPVLQPDTEPNAVTTVRNGPAEPGHVPGDRARPTRITVDLAGDLHPFLRDYSRARNVAAADVIRELIRQVRADPCRRR